MRIVSKFGLKTELMVEKGRNKASKNFGLYAEKIASMEAGGQKTVLAAAGISLIWVDTITTRFSKWS